MGVKDGESSLSCDMKDKIRTDFTARYENRLLDNVLDPGFSDSLLTKEEEVKVILLQKCNAPRQSEKQVQAVEQLQWEAKGYGGQVASVLP